MIPNPFPDRPREPIMMFNSRISGIKVVAGSVESIHPNLLAANTKPFLTEVPIDELTADLPKLDCIDSSHV
jgi:hypothetical protein